MGDHPAGLGIGKASPYHSSEGELAQNLLVGTVFHALKNKRLGVFPLDETIVPPRVVFSSPMPLLLCKLEFIEKRQNISRTMDDAIDQYRLPTHFVED